MNLESIGRARTPARQDGSDDRGVRCGLAARCCRGGGQGPENHRHQARWIDSPDRQQGRRSMTTLRMATLEGVTLMARVASVLLLAACAAPDTPSSPTRQLSLASGETGNAALAISASRLPSWVINPSALPDGRIGKNNCKFPFGQNVPQWDFHPDAGCWEHAGPDGWTRQQFQQIHVPIFPSCGGGSGDATAIVVCRAGGSGQRSPCLIDPLTRGVGCARCVVNPRCH